MIWNSSRFALAPLLAVLLLVPALPSNALPLRVSFAATPALEDGPHHTHTDLRLPTTAPTAPDDARWEPASQAPYHVQFKCPEFTKSDIVDISCPAYVLDAGDVMGQPRLLVDPQDEDLIAFNALHGGRGLWTSVDQQPPSERSRYNAIHQPHTTFQSDTRGAAWVDNRYHSPLRGKSEDERRVFGEDNAAALDGSGRIYLASLYAYKDASAKDYTYAIALWKSQRINRPVEYDKNLQLIHPRENGSRIDSVHLAYVAQTDSVVAIWRESRGPGALAWIEAARSKPGGPSTWERLPLDQSIGPCRAISNPVVQRDSIVVGCFPDKGYAHDSDAALLGELQLHALHAARWTSTRTGAVPLTQGNPVMAPMPRGLLAVGAAGVGGDGRPFVHVIAGKAGGAWSDLRDFGAQFSNATGGLRVAHARLQALTFIEDSGSLHAIYMERYAPPAGVQTSTSVVSHYKALGAIRTYGDFLGKADLGLGNPRNRITYPQQGQADQQTLFDDLHDDIVLWRDPKTGQELEFIAYADFGYIRFAEIVERNFAPFAFPPVEPVPPVPLATPGANPALYGIPAGILALSMLARLLASRRKHAAEAPSL